MNGGAVADGASTGAAPGLLRRMASFAYEGLLLFGVLMISGYLYSSLTQQRHALHGLHGLQAFLFFVLGLYFVWFWSHGGQTVAMRTWRIRLVAIDGGPVRPGRALCRYLASWVWFVPPLALAAAAHLDSVTSIFGLLGAWIASYALLALLHPQRQFWHDALCGTRLVNHTPAPR